MSGVATQTADGAFDVHVMEYIAGGDLLRFAQRQPDGFVDEWILRPIMWDVATAIRDVKRMGSAIILVCDADGHDCVGRVAGGHA